jgi:hypothetical protein
VNARATARCWRVGKKGVVAADGKPTNEPAKEELFTIDCPVNGHGVGWTIRSCSHLLYLRPEVRLAPPALALTRRRC